MKRHQQLFQYLLKQLTKVWQVEGVTAGKSPEEKPT
jgi:hypothetical protein